MRSRGTARRRAWGAGCVNGGARGRPGRGGACAGRESTFCLSCMHTHRDLGFTGDPAHRIDVATRSESHRVVDLGLIGEPAHCLSCCILT